VPAAGRGERLGPGTPKALREIAGVPMLVHAVHALAASPAVDLVVIAAPESEVEHVSGLVGRSTFNAEVSVVSGGATRQESVARALITLPADVDVVLVHDAARPLVPVEMVTAVVASVREGHPCVIPCLSVADTIKEVDAHDMVVRTVDREVLRAVQTPQGFDVKLLKQCHQQGIKQGWEVTDDAALFEKCGYQVHIVEGEETNLKVTTPQDLAIAQFILQQRQ
jgi:2-C-methyl-D-erythritol 4-phosphate cytidylyltransferase